MTLPNFILAGAPKAGTSSLWGYIRQHPDIFTAPDKEVFFFDFNWEKGLAWYEERFADYAGQSAIGEATVWYMRWPSVPERLSSVLPNVKLLFLLRNPVDRAYSNWCHEKRDGIHPFNQGFAEFLTREDRDNRTILSSGYYAQHLKRWLQHFPREQMHVDYFENFCADPKAYLQSVFRFLEVETNVAIDTNYRDNESWWYRGEALLKFIDAIFSPLKKVSGLDPVGELWRRRHFRQLFHDRKLRPPKLAQRDRAELIEHYRPHNAELADLMGMSFDHWNK